MGFLKKIGKSIGNSLSKAVNNGTQFFSEFIQNPTESVGKLLNDVTGVTASARQQAEAQTKLQQMAQDFNAEQATIERDWQTEMSNTARQRAVEDSQKAGVNPILAAGGTAAGASAGAGAAATSPGGSASTGVGTNPISMITELIKASNNTAKTNAEIKNIDAQVKNINADTNLKKQTHSNGGNGGTALTRTIAWSARRTKENEEKLKKDQEKHGMKFWKYGN